MRRLGFEYYSIGRKPVLPTPWASRAPMRVLVTGRRGIHRLAPLRVLPRQGLTTSSAWTTSSRARRTTSRASASRPAASRFVEHDVTEYIRRRRAPRLGASLRQPGLAPRLPGAADPDAEGRRARYAQAARPGQGQGRALPARLDLRGVRRPARAPAARGLLGQREPGRPARRLRRGQALRRGDHDGLPPRAHGVDTRIVRIFNTFGPRMRLEGRARHPRVHQPGADRRAPHGVRRRLADALVPVHRRPRRRHLAPHAGAGQRPRQHRQPARDDAAGAGQAHHAAHRLHAARSCSARCRRTIRRSASRTSRGPARCSAGSRAWTPTKGCG